MPEIEKSNSSDSSHGKCLAKEEIKTKKGEELSSDSNGISSLEIWLKLRNEDYGQNIKFKRRLIYFFMGLISFGYIGIIILLVLSRSCEKWKCLRVLDISDGVMVAFIQSIRYSSALGLLYFIIRSLFSRGKDD
jgi:hypothetical protein